MIGLLRKIANIYRNKVSKDLYARWYSLATTGKNFTVLGASAVENESKDPSRIIIGDNTRIVSAAIVAKRNAHISVGDFCVIQNNSSITCLEKVSIGNYVGIASNTSITDNNTHALGTENWIRHRIRAAPGGPGYPGLGNGWELADSAPVTICDAVWIGSGCRILKGVTIGEGAVVASGSVVTKDVEPFSIVAGNPAKKVKSLERPSKTIDEIAKEILTENT